MLLSAVQNVLEQARFSCSTLCPSDGQIRFQTDSATYSKNNPPQMIKRMKYDRILSAQSKANCTYPAINDGIIARCKLIVLDRPACICKPYINKTFANYLLFLGLQRSLFRIYSQKLSQKTPYCLFGCMLILYSRTSYYHSAETFIKTF